MLRARKVASANLKIGKLPLTLATSNFQGFFVNKLDSKSNLFKVKRSFRKEFITKKQEEDIFSPRIKYKVNITEIYLPNNQLKIIRIHDFHSQLVIFRNLKVNQSCQFLKTQTNFLFAVKRHWS